MSDLYNRLDSPFKEGASVVFKSIYACARNGSRARIAEVKDGLPDTTIFPLGLAYRIQYEDDLRETWCRVDELIAI